MSSDNINKIIKKLCKEIFPKDVFQKGNSRVYIDDNGYYFTIIEFQPHSLKNGTCLNVGIDFLFDKSDLAFSYAFNKSVRVGEKFIDYINDEQFENEIRKYVELANDYIFRYRTFADIKFAKQYIFNELNDDNWNPYIKSMFCYLTDDIENGQKYYEIWSNDSFFERIINRDNYPKDSSELSKEYVMNFINEQRKFYHSKSYMKKMKTYEEYER